MGIKIPDKEDRLKTIQTIYKDHLEDGYADSKETIKLNLYEKLERETAFTEAIQKLESEIIREQVKGPNS